MLGQSIKVSGRWIGPLVTKVLITTRWRLNTLIDGGQPKPADVTQEQWNTLVRRRNTQESQITSDHMRSISQGKGSTMAQLKAIERDAIVKLVQVFFLHVQLMSITHSSEHARLHSCFSVLFNIKVLIFYPVLVACRPWNTVGSHTKPKSLTRWHENTLDSSLRNGRVLFRRAQTWTMSVLVWLTLRAVWHV